MSRRSKSILDRYAVMRPLHRSLGFRLLVFVGVSLVMMLGFGSYYTHRMQRQHVLDETLTAMENLADLACYTSMLHMLEGDPQHLQAIIDEMVETNRSISSIRILDKEGVVSKSTLDADRGVRVDETSHSCTVCHRDGSSGAEIPGRWIEIVDSAERGHREARISHAVRNQPGCASGCHGVHDESAHVLGVFEIVMPLDEVDERIAKNRLHLILISVGSFVLIMGILAGTLMQYYIRPINALLTGIRDVTTGKFDKTIPVYRKDEFGYLARSLNQMVKNLDRDIAYRNLLMYDGSIPDEDGSEEPAVIDDGVGPSEEVETEDMDVGADFEDMYKLLQDETHIKLVRAVKLASLGQLSAGIAHEINNPLTAVLSYSSLLLERAKTDKEREWLEIVVSEAKRCRNIVAGLLEFSRQSLPEKSHTQVNDIVERAITLVEHKESFHNITFVKDLEPDLPRIYIDRGQIYQVFTNLIINAGDAMEGQGTLTIGSRIHTIPSKVAPDRRFVEITIEDTGCGIPADNIERIFDPFFTTKGPTVGTGLGLSICFGIIKRHGGNITVESTVGEGSTFTIHLPIKKEGEREDD